MPKAATAAWTATGRERSDTALLITVSNTNKKHVNSNDNNNNDTIITTVLI